MNLTAQDGPPSSAHELLESTLPQESAPAPSSVPRYSNSTSRFRNTVSLNENPIRDPPKNQPNVEYAQRLFAESARKRNQLVQENRMRPKITADTYKDLADHNMRAGLTKQITRRWKAGDVYAPHDLSGVEMLKWKKRHQPERDVFDVLDFNPEQHYRVCSSLFPTCVASSQ
jgi:small subunit ribosomal protein S18